jgi:hypothetical protein
VHAHLMGIGGRKLRSRNISATIHHPRIKAK